MKFLRAWLNRLGGTLSNARREGEIADELESHLQLHTDENIRAGMAPNEARRVAILTLGGVEATKEAWREQSTVPMIEHLWQDLRFAVRQLRKNPGFTAAATLMLALGMCAGVSIFAFVDAALLQPLPYRDPTRLLGVFGSVAMFPENNLSYPDYLDWKKQNTVLQSLEAYQRSGFLLATPTGAEPARGARVTAGFFRMLGVTPFLGRDFHEGEDLPAAPRVVLLSYGAWQRRFAGRADVVGQSVSLDGDSNVIIGVLPRDFHFAPAEPAEFWMALHATRECDLRRGCHSMYGIGRLNDGVSQAVALANLTAIARHLEQQYPESNRGQGAALSPLSEVIIGRARPTLLLLLSGAGLLLLIAAANVASLLLVRCESRRREVAVRNALGASRARLIRQFVTEGLVLAAGGSALGILAARSLAQLLTGFIPADLLSRMPFLRDPSLNLRVLAFAGAIAILAAVLFSFTPILRLSLSRMRAGLAEGSRGSAGTLWRHLGSKLVVIELATATVLLVGAGLLGQSLHRLMRVDLGFRPDHLATLQVNAPDSTYTKDEQVIAFTRRLLYQVEALPGVQSAALASSLPVGGNGNTTWVRILGRPWHGEHIDIPFREVSPAYFNTLGAKLWRGRVFSEADDASKPRVAIINRAVAKLHFPDEDPIGKQFSFPSNPPQPIEIVGIVEDIREGPLEVPIPPVLYFPFNQSTSTYFGLVVRTSLAEKPLLPVLAATIRQMDRNVVTVDPATMPDRIANSPSAYLHRSSAWLVGGFAALALILGVMGTYGVVAYSVSQRTREIGVRIALGAERGAVYRLVLKEAGGLTLAGIAMGLLCALAAGRLLRSLLFGVNSWDVLTFGAVACLLGGAALAASFIPARRAAQVNPLEALRSE